MMRTDWRHNCWRQRRCRRFRWRGFTVVELLVVVSVISVLVSLCVGSLSRAKPAALSVNCKANLHQLTLALAMYVNEQNCYPLFDYADGDLLRFWPDLIEPGLSAGLRQSHLEPNRWLVFQCPAGAGNRSGPSLRSTLYGYTAEGYALRGLGKKLELEALTVRVGAVRESDVQVPARAIALGDGIARLRDGTLLRSGISLDRWALWDPLLKEIRTAPELQAEDKIVRSLHANRANMSYCDGHVEGSTLKFLFEAQTDAALCRWNRDNQAHRECLTR